MPQISVIMGTYNGEKTINRAIESILNQSYKDFELIICDDSSVDNTVKIIEKYMLYDKRIVLLKNKSNMKLSMALNKCLLASTGDYIARMDDDDIAHVERLQVQLDYFKQHPEIDILGTSRNMYDDNGIWGSDVKNEKKISAVNIALGESFIHPSVMMRRECLIRVNGYTVNEKVERVEDLDLWFKLFSNGYKGYVISDILLNYYEDLNSYRKRAYKYRINEYYVKKKWTKKLDLSFICRLFSFKPLIIGLLPHKILLKQHKNKYILQKIS